MLVWDRSCKPNPVSPKRLPTQLFIRTATKWTVVMQDKNSEKFPAAFKYSLLTSPAFLDLKPASRIIFILFLFEIKFKKLGRKKKWTTINENNIVLPYKEIRERLKYTDKTIWTAIQDIMAHGFMNIKEYGGKGKGDFTVYRIKTEWRQWLPGETLFRARVSGKVGFQKKG